MLAEIFQFTLKHYCINSELFVDISGELHMIIYNIHIFIFLSFFLSFFN